MNELISTKSPKLSRTRKPIDMSVKDWQIALRRQFGREQNYEIERAQQFLWVRNPQSGGRYKVRIRGENPGENYCSCPDFTINTLGTCKHIEFVLSTISEFPGTTTYAEIFLRYGSKREVIFRPGDETSTELQALALDYFNSDGVLNSDRYQNFGAFLSVAQKLEPGLFCCEHAIERVIQIRDMKTLEERVDAIFPKGDSDSNWANLLKASLYPYQREGAFFAAKTGRCIIADEMGLGKTIQALAAAEILSKAVGIEKVLIICPASLKHQWANEIRNFTDRSASVVEGNLIARREKYRDSSFFKIVNYENIPRDLDEVRHLQPDLIILDEAQRIKNWKTRTSQTVKRLSSEYVIVLTGTPLENRLEELHSIMEMVDRFHLGPLFQFLAEHQILDECGQVTGYQKLNSVAKTLKAVALRRKKSEVLTQLPERIDKTYFVPMTPEQMNLHEENRETVSKIVRRWRKSGFLSEKDQHILMVSLQNMRMSCDNTYLLDHQTTFGPKIAELSSCLGDTAEKVIIFSQWVAMHELIIKELEAQKIDYAFLHGGIPSKNRGPLIDRFQNDPKCRVFLSTDAGGVGLNLQAASVVINMDLPWNPAVLEQRIGRAHRMGQKQPVRVINFVSQGTIEHSMLDLLAFKKSLFAGVLDGGEDDVFMGGSRLKRFMESVEQVSAQIPQAVSIEEPETIQFESLSEADVSPSAAPASDLLSTGMAILQGLPPETLERMGKFLLELSKFGGFNSNQEAVL